MDKFYEEIVKDVKDDFERRREARKNYELQWRLNMNFLMGNQYCEISPRGDIEDVGKQYFWQEREVFNHIASIVETRLAKLGRVKAGISVRPSSSDNRDENAAKFSTRILSATCDENRLTELMAEANTWSEVTGTAFYKINWNAGKGKLAGVDDNNKPIYEGDVELSVCPPYEIFPDSNNAADISLCRSLIHAKAYPVAQIKEIWGKEISGEQIDVFTMSSSEVSGGLGYSASVPKVVFEKRDGYAVVIERYDMPTKERPDGTLSIVAGDKLLYYGVLPYCNLPNGKRTVPFVRQLCMKQAGSFFGNSVIERIIPVQRAYNAVKNRKHEFLNRLAMGVLAVEDGSIDIDNIEEEGLSPGKVLIYRQGSNPPHLLDAGKVPNEFDSEEDRLLNEFMLISGISDSNKYAQLTASNVSGVALSLLVEQDDTRLSIASDYIRNAIKNLGQQILLLYKQFAVNKRMKRICGDSGEIEMLYFNASDITADDLVFDTDNELTETPASRKNMVLEILKLGLFNGENGELDARMKSRALNLLGFGNWENGRDLSDLSIKAAMKENLTIGGGGNVEVSEADEHELHIQEHTKYLIGEHKGAPDKILEHIRLHKRYAAMSAKAAANNLSEGNNAGKR